MIFVVPDWEAAISGGNLYNQRLTTALREAGADVRVVQREAFEGNASEICFVDSLYLDDFLRLQKAAAAPCYLLTHYLPSLVAGTEITDGEREVIAEADGFLAPSEFMAHVVG